MWLSPRVGGASMTVDLLRQRGIEPRIVGRPMARRSVKMLDVGLRAAELSRAFVTARPDMLLGTSRSVGSRWLGYAHPRLRVL